MNEQEIDKMKLEFEQSRKDFEECVFKIHGYRPRWTTLNNYSHQEDRILFRGWQLAGLAAKKDELDKNHIKQQCPNCDKWEAILKDLQIAVGVLKSKNNPMRTVEDLIDSDSDKWKIQQETADGRFVDHVFDIFGGKYTFYNPKHAVAMLELCESEDNNKYRIVPC